MSFDNGGDPEKNISTKETLDSPASPERPAWDDTAAPPPPWTTRFVDSFRRDPNATITKSDKTVARGHFDHAAAAANTANSGLARKLKSRHMQMIAIGGAIGTSLADVIVYEKNELLMHEIQVLVSSSPPEPPSPQVVPPPS